jgi:hypothetical protein
MHRRVFDRAPQLRLGADVVTHSCRDSRNHAKKKTRRRFGFGSGFGIVICACLVPVRQRLHDRQPATGVVAMPITMMAAIIRKHCSGFITDAATACQTILATDYTDRL